MQNKIIKLKSLAFEKLKAGGGSPDMKAPLDISNLLLMVQKLEGIKPFMGDRIMSLIHNSTDENGLQTPIPAPSRRFISSLKVIFGSTTFTYESTRYNKSKDKLEFLYIVNYEQVLEALKRLKLIINFYNDFKKKNESWADTFTRALELEKDTFTENTKVFKTKNNLKLISYTGLLKLFSEQFHLFRELTIDAEDDIETNENEQGNLKFSSIKHLEKAEKILASQHVEITYINRDKSAPEIDFLGAFKGKIHGVLKSSVISQHATSYEKEKIFDVIETAVLNKYKLFPAETNSTWVGVIDGGISKKSILMTEIEYDDNLTMGFGEANEQGDHAENVVSLLLWTNKLNPTKANDFGTSPNVHLFNVLTEEDNVGQIKHKVETILKIHHKKIKIWNLSFVVQDIKQNEALSELCVFFDFIQKKYDVLFIFATGNASGENQPIEAPSGSFRGISVSAVKSNGEPTSYALNGGGKFINSKPDLSTFGGDEEDEINVISQNCLKRSSGGTSFAAPLVTRKVAQLYHFGFSLHSIPAILIASASYNSKNKINAFHEKIGFGILPMSSKEIFELINNKALIVLDQEIGSDYSQGFFKIRMPKFDEHFDQNLYFGINIDGTLEKHATYEYVKDCTRISFGRLDPFENKLFGTAQHSSDDEEGANESFLRAYRGKFKTRDVFKDEIKRPRVGVKKKKSGQEQEINYWGIKIVRNLIDSNRKKVGGQKIAMCIIVDCIYNQSFYDEFISLNNKIIQNLDIDVITELADEITFE